MNLFIFIFAPLRETDTLIYIFNIKERSRRSLTSFFEAKVIQFFELRNSDFRIWRISTSEFGALLLPGLAIFIIL